MQLYIFATLKIRFLLYTLYLICFFKFVHFKTTSWNYKEPVKSTVSDKKYLPVYYFLERNLVISSTNKNIFQKLINNS